MTQEVTPQAAPSTRATDADSATLANLLHETRSFAPSDEFSGQANAQASLYDDADGDRLGFWADQARKHVTWNKDFTEVLDWSNAPVARWFADGTLNAAYNAVDRHVKNGLGDRVAFHFEGEPGDSRSITYAELQLEVCRAANALAALRITTGDRVIIYAPMLIESVIAMLACARIGAPHSVVFGGFSAEALRSRIEDAGAKLVITADGGYRRGAPAALKPAVDEALSALDAAGTNPVERTLVIRRTGQDVAWVDGRDIWWHDALAPADVRHEPVWVKAEHPLFILYTSGTTGKPKGILHTTGGYLVQTAHTHHNVFDLKADTDVYWCTADIGWVTGHSYVVYGPMLGGATQVIYEGTPDSPHRGRWWEIVEKYGVSILYTAPTAIRTFMKWGDDIPSQFDLSSLRLLGSVGEPINPEAWMWYRKVIGANLTPIVDTWWQTETGAIMISPLPGVTATKPGSAQVPMPGTSIDVIDEEARSVPNGSGGYLVIKEPWPSMLRGIWGDLERFKQTYWSRFPGMYFAGDGAKRDDDGDIWLLGRVDDVMNVSGHRLSTTEIESSLVAHDSVAEAAVVGATDETTGQAVVAFVILRQEFADQAAQGDKARQIEESLRSHVSKQIGPIAKPRQILLVPELPKTRSGKIMRRLLRDVAEHRNVGDSTTLADSSVMDLIASRIK